MCDDIRVVCCLSDAELRKREATILAEFKCAVIATEELSNGYAFRIPGEKKSIAAVAELIVVERECCPFLTLELAAQPNMGPVIVRMTGPAETKELLKTILCECEGLSSISLPDSHENASPSRSDNT